MSATYTRYGQTIPAGNTLPASARVGDLFYLTVGALGVYNYGQDLAWHLFDNLSWSGGEILPIYTLADFPEPVAGVITLQDATNYLIVGEVNIGTNTIRFGARSAIRGENRVNDRLVYSGTGTMFTASSGAITAVFNEIGLRAPNGTLIDFSDVAVSFINVSLGPIKTGGTFAFSGAFPFTFRQGAMSAAFTTGGFTFSGTTTGTLRIFDNTISNNAGTVFALGAAVVGTIDISRNVVLSNASQTFLSGSGASNVSIAGHLSDNTFSGAGTAVSGIAATDTPWIFIGNHGVTNGVTATAWGTLTGTLSAQTDLQTALDAKLATTGNGSGLTGLTKSQVGLANVDNTSDANKPISTATQTALNGKQVAGSYATAAQGATADSALQPGGNGASLTGLTKSQVGLSNADNTSDANKPVSSATQAALDAKQASLISGTNLKTVNNSTLLGSGDLAVSAADPSYTPGSFTVATGAGRMVIKRMQLTTTQRATLAGTSRLKVA